jgi:hypothetical protein
MTGLSEWMMHGGPFSYAALAIGLLCAVFVAGLAACSLARLRIPLPLWIAPGALMVGFGAITTFVQARKAQDLLARASLEAMPQTATAIYAALTTAEILSLILSSLIFGASALSASIGVLQTQRREISLLYGAAPVAYGAIGGLGILISGIALTGLQPPVLGLSALTFVMSLALGLATGVGSKSRREVERIAEIRVAVIVVAALALWTWCLGWRMAYSLAGATDAAQLALPPALSGMGAFALLVVGGAGALGIGSVARHLLTPRTLSGGLVACVMIALVGLAKLGASLSSRDVAYDALGGALQDEPMLRLSTLPSGESLGGENRAVPLHATCLTTDGRTGWRARNRYRTFGVQHHLDRAIKADTPVSEIDSLPGCPQKPTLLSGPLSTFERPAIVIAGDRMAAAITGYEWFLQEGEVQVLTVTDALEPSSPRVRPLEVQAVSFRWERPPKNTQPAPPPEGGEVGEWNYPAARVMLRGVLLLEGPVPMIIADGRRAWLKEGQAGETQLRDAMTRVQRRDLVLVPRKHWTVQDLVRYCLAISDMEESRCVIRPENTERWTERTGLALPW